MDTLQYEQTRLLSLQSRYSLQTWCRERGLPHDGDCVQTIVDYYSYLDVLCIPSTDSTNVDLAFTNYEVLATLVSWCKPYLLNILRSVNKLLSELIPAIGSYLVADGFIDDVFSTMCWRHIHRIIVESSSPHLAAKQGYELILPYVQVAVNYTSLMNTVAENSDHSDKYFNLFVKYHKLHSDGKGYYEMDTYYSLCRSVISGDMKIFNYALSKTDRTCLKDNGLLLTQLFFYFRVEMINIYTKYTDNDICSLYHYQCIVLTSAYCGGHYEEASTYLEKSISKEEICREMFIGRVMNVANLDLLTDIIEHWVHPDEVRLFSYIRGIKYTLKEFKRLWLKMDAIFTERDMSYTISSLVPSLVLDRRIDIVYHLISSDDHVRDNVDRGSLYRKVNTTYTKPDNIIAKLDQLLA